MKTFHTLVGIIFLVVAVGHVFRLMNGWSVTVGPWTVPMEVSWVAVVVAGYLSWTSFKLK